MRPSRHWLWLLLLVPIALGLARLRFDTEVLNLLPSDFSVVRGLKLYQTNFANARELIVTVSATDGDATELAVRELAQALLAATNLVTRVTWQPPWLEHPGEFAEFVAYLWLNQPPEIFSALTNRLAARNLSTILREAQEALTTSLSPADIGRRGYDPFNLTQLPDSVTGGAPGFGEGNEIFSSADGTFRIVFVQARPDLGRYKDCIAWLKQVKDLETALRARGSLKPDVTIRYTGRPAFVAEIAGGMENDLAGPSAGTLAVIALLFYISHRRWRPLLWLLVMLVVILAGTTALGGLIYGTLNVVSLGFASILLGLAEDFGIVLYQESRSHPDLSLQELRRAAWPGILWSTVTTSGAFLLLNLSGLSGLGQLGTLVAIGIALSAVVMLYLYLPPLLRRRNAEDRGPKPEKMSPTPRASRRTSSIAWVLTGLLLLLSIILLVHRLPGFDNSPDALRPRHSPTYDAVDEIKRRMKRTQEPMWVLVTGHNESEVAQRLDTAQSALATAVSNQLIGSFALPVALWPRPEVQAANRPAAAALVALSGAFRDSLPAAGFTSNSFALTEGILHTWQAALARQNVFWPTNPTSEWILEKVFARNARELLAIGLVYPPTHDVSGGTNHVELKLKLGTRNSKLIALADELAPKDILLSGWEMLGYSVLARMKVDFWRVLIPMFVLLAVSLWLAFRNMADILISLIALAFSALCLWAVMSLVGWSWNLLNLLALPLLLGMGVDFSIHMQLALRRHRGDLGLVSGSIGRALLLAGATTVAGFASLILSSNAGMASLGKVCAVGISCAMFTSIFLLPAWWKFLHHGGRGPNPVHDAPDGIHQHGRPTLPPKTPSSFYRAGVWRFGLLAARWLPASFATGLAQLVVSAYALVASHRRLVVEHNLLPVLKDDPGAARRMGWKLFRQFAVKLTDLLRYEAGRPVDHLFVELTGWDHFVAAQDKRRGVLLVTPHLGNWEFGGPLLTLRGYKLQVITLAEPGRDLTEMRQASRARWGIETLVMGEDPFAFVEVIRRLEAGATVALLIDRPPAANAVRVDLFGRPFDASIAAAELARASGCAVLPVYLPRQRRGYAAHILPEVPYERAALRSRDARVQLTQQIMRAFEPALRQHPDQWYHFVPIWPQT